MSNYNNDLDLFFIGFSFGESDHYFFQEVKDWINLHYGGQSGKIPPVSFNIFVHSNESKLSFLYNLRVS